MGVSTYYCIVLMICYQRDGCVWSTIASLWVDFYHSLFTSIDSNEEKELKMSLIQQDLSTCLHRLHSKEDDLREKIRLLGMDALKRRYESIHYWTTKT